jgi:prevent-host-death family protein
MMRTLKESKAKLSELVERASQGEDVLITVHGQVKARLTRAGEAADTVVWAEELKELQATYGTRKAELQVEQILAEDREDRS